MTASSRHSARRRALSDSTSGHPPTAALPWVPPNARATEALPAGLWWDAVRVPADLGATALTVLGDNTGAVIADHFGNLLYWLVQPHAADGWAIPGVAVRGAPCHVAVPPAAFTQGPGPHWRVPLAPGCYLTPPTPLHAALTIAAAGGQEPAR